MKNPTTSRPLILIIDDDPAMRQGMRLILGRDYEVVEAASVTESLEAFDRAKPDLITLDINMPEIDGLEGLDYLRRRSSRIPIILVSGERSFELAQEALRLGATDYLTKPFPTEALRQAVKSALTKFLFPEETEMDSDDFVRSFKLRLPLENLREESFLSPQHCSRFLAFAQNVLSEKERAFETISIAELIRTISIQFESLRLVDKHTVYCSDSRMSLQCDMYLLGGALANLLLTCILKTKDNPAPVEIVFEHADQKLRIVYRKAGSKLPTEMLAAYDLWREQRPSILDADSGMLALTQKVASVHRGQVNVKVPDTLVEIQIPLRQAARG